MDQLLIFTLMEIYFMGDGLFQATIEGAENRIHDLQKSLDRCLRNIKATYVCSHNGKEYEVLVTTPDEKSQKLAHLAFQTTYTKRNVYDQNDNGQDEARALLPIASTSDNSPVNFRIIYLVHNDFKRITMVIEADSSSANQTSVVNFLISHCDAMSSANHTMHQIADEQSWVVDITASTKQQTKQIFEDLSVILEPRFLKDSSSETSETSDTSSLLESPLPIAQRRLSNRLEIPETINADFSYNFHLRIPKSYLHDRVCEDLTDVGPVDNIRFIQHNDRSGIYLAFVRFSSVQYINDIKIRLELYKPRPEDDSDATKQAGLVYCYRCNHEMTVTYHLQHKTICPTNIRKHGQGTKRITNDRKYNTNAETRSPRILETRIRHDTKCLHPVNQCFSARKHWFCGRVIHPADWQSHLHDCNPHNFKHLSSFDFITPSVIKDSLEILPPPMEFEDIIDSQTKDEYELPTEGIKELDLSLD